MSRKVVIITCLIFILGLFGCNHSNNIKEEKEQKLIEVVPKEELIKYNIQNLDYFNLKYSAYAINTDNITLTFYDTNVMKGGISQNECFLALILNGTEYIIRDEKLACFYTQNRIDENLMEIEYNYKQKDGDYYFNQQMMINATQENKGQSLIFKFNDGTEIKVNNSYYDEILNLNIGEVLVDKLGRVYTLDGSPIYPKCTDINLCKSINYPKINPDEYIITDYIDEERNTIYPDIEYIDNVEFGGGSYGLTFYKDYTCEAYTITPSYYAQNYFTNCNYAISKKDDKTYLITLSLSYYYDIQHTIIEKSLLFEGYAKKGQVFAIKSLSPEAVSVFQDYKNYDNVIEMYKSND